MQQSAFNASKWEHSLITLMQDTETVNIGFPRDVGEGLHWD
jgi:hypothetical protein